MRCARRSSETAATINVSHRSKTLELLYNGYEKQLEHIRPEEIYAIIRRQCGQGWPFGSFTPPLRKISESADASSAK